MSKLPEHVHDWQYDPDIYELGKSLSGHLCRPEFIYIDVHCECGRVGTATFRLTKIEAGGIEP